MYVNVNVSCPEHHRDAYQILKRQYRLLKKHGILVPASTCAKCGATEANSGMPLELHHIVPLRQPVEGLNHNNPNNIHTLCHVCHMVWHKCVEGMLTYSTWMSNQSIDTDRKLLNKYMQKRQAKRIEAIRKHKSRTHSNV